LPDDIKMEYATSFRHVPKSVLIEIAALKDSTEQRAMWQRIKEGKATVRAVREIKDGAAAPSTSMVPVRHLFSHVRRAVKDLALLHQERLRLDDAQREELRILRRLLDDLLEEG
jgi:hypothetical protein